MTTGKVISSDKTKISLLLLMPGNVTFIHTRIDKHSMFFLAGPRVS